MNAPSRWLHDRVARLIREFMKFGVVGGVAFVVDMGLNNLLRTTVLEHKPITAKVLSVAVATVVAYLGNRHWTFRHRPDPNMARGFTAYAVLNVIGLGIALGCLWFSHYVLGFTSLLADNISGNIIGTGMGTLFRFWSYRRWVFVAAEGKDADGHDLINARSTP